MCLCVFLPKFVMDAQQPQQQFPIEQWYFEVPPITRTYATLVVATTLLCVRICGCRQIRLIFRG